MLTGAVGAPDETIDVPLSTYFPKEKTVPSTQFNVIFNFQK